MSDGLPQASLILGATAIFASLAWSAGMTNTPTTCPQTTEVVRYFPAQEIKVVMPLPPLGWPVESRARAEDAEQKAEPASNQEDVAEEQPRRHYRRHRRHWGR